LNKGRVLPWIRKKIHWKYDRMICCMIDAVGKGQANILELGCAPGDILERIYRLRPDTHLDGIDYSEKGIDITKKRLSVLGIEADIYFGDFRTLHLPKRYDMTVSFGLIEHFDNPIEILEYHKNFVAPGGLVGVSVPNFSSPLVKGLMEWFNPEVLKRHNLAIMNEKEIRRTFEECGMRHISVGGAGGPRLYLDSSGSGIAFQVCAMLVSIWNLLVSFLPDMFWNAHIWGIGRVE